MADLRSLVEEDPPYQDPDPGPGGEIEYGVINQNLGGSSPPPTGGGGNGTGGGGVGGGFGGDRPIFNIPNAPKFSYGNFVPPDPRDIANDPNFQFRRDQGVQAIERSNAAKGILRTGGNFKDLGTYVSNFSANEAQGAYDRALRSHMANLDIERARFAPSIEYWRALAAAETAGSLAQYGRYTQWNAPHQGGGGGPEIPPPPDPEVSAF
jgi:hypothetical protein